MNIISLLYNLIVIPIAQLVIAIIKPFNKKLKEREDAWQEVMTGVDKLNLVDNNSPRIWFHASSMGEFEQAKPIIERIKKLQPKYKIIVSFFSPSGYNNQKDYAFADAVLYIPFDKKSNAKYFIETIKPTLAVFVRYDIWRNHLEVLNKKGIPIYLICATIPNNKFLYKCKSLQSFTRSNYNFFKKIFAVSEEHTQLFKSLKIKTNIETSSDTRFDRIIENVELSKKERILPNNLFSNNEFVLIAGSTWFEDEEVITTASKKFEKEFPGKLRLILVPHEPNIQNIQNLKEIIPNSFLLSEVLNFSNKERQESIVKKFLGRNHIIVDSIGKLLKLYAFADAAYIGGGFGSGIHSVTEPAGYGIPLCTGPKITNSPDAIKLNSLGAVTIIGNETELYQWMKDIINSKNKKVSIGKISKKYVYNANGASDIIAKKILEEI